MNEMGGYSSEYEMLRIGLAELQREMLVTQCALTLAVRGVPVENWSPALLSCMGWYAPRLVKELGVGAAVHKAHGTSSKSQDAFETLQDGPPVYDAWKPPFEWQGDEG